MLKRHAICSSLLLLILSSSEVLAQSEVTKSNKQSGATITAFATGERVRFTAPSSVVQMRLEVYGSNGEKLFDNELKGGNVLDWLLQNGQAERLAVGSYLCVITAKSISGKLTQRIGSVTIEKMSATVQPVDALQMTARQLQAVGPVEENASVTVLNDDDNQTTTVIAHNGEEGQLIRGRGALSFRIGDFFSGKDSEQMRLTPEGNLGIGITNPLARLDVDGLIRTSQGIVFPDGTIQTTAAIIPSAGSTEAEKPKVNPPKLADLSNAGKSAKRGKGGKVSPEFTVNEDLTVNGNIIFTPAFFRDITMQNNNGGLRFYGAPSLTGTPDAAAIQFWGNNSGFPGQAYIDSGAHNQAAVIFRTAQTGGTIAERMRVTSSGNVGIGTASPQSKLHLFGSAGFFTPFLGLTIDQVVNSSSNQSGYALKVMTTRDGLTSTDFLISSNGNVGIGVASPQVKLEVNGGSDIGVFGVSDGNNYGVWGNSRGSGNKAVGVYGSSINGSGFADGKGVYGESGSGPGVEGASASGAGLVGLSSFGDLIQGKAMDAISISFRVGNDGKVHAPAYLGLPDFAEAIRPGPADKIRLEPGDVLVASSHTDRSVTRSTKPYSTSVLGVYSTAPGFVGTEHPIEGASSETIPMAVIGIVPCKVSAENGSIKRGDLLTTSSTPGHAMRCANRRKCIGAIVGKALSTLDNGIGVIPVLVTLQ